MNGTSKNTSLCSGEGRPPPSRYLYAISPGSTPEASATQADDSKGTHQTVNPHRQLAGNRGLPAVEKRCNCAGWHQVVVERSERVAGRTSAPTLFFFSVWYATRDGAEAALVVLDGVLVPHESTLLVRVAPAVTAEEEGVLPFAAAPVRLCCLRCGTRCDY